MDAYVCMVCKCMIDGHVMQADRQTRTHAGSQCTRTCMYVCIIDRGTKEGTGGVERAGGRTDAHIRPSIPSPIKHASNPRGQQMGRTDRHAHALGQHTHPPTRIVSYHDMHRYCNAASPPNTGRQVVIHDGRVGGGGERGEGECVSV